MKRNLVYSALLALVIGALGSNQLIATGGQQQPTPSQQEPTLLQRGVLWVAEKAMSLQQAAVDKIKAMPAGKDRDDLVLKLYQALDKADAQFAELAKTDTNPAFVNRINALRAQIANAKRSLPTVSTRPDLTTAPVPAVGPILPT
ncbi:MAG: hypothetical protein AB7F19_06675 [Candidatus Babeliales bacterium]